MLHFASQKKYKKYTEEDWPPKYSAKNKIETLP
jgi:hypothetical protein